MGLINARPDASIERVIRKEGMANPLFAVTRFKSARWNFL